MTKTQTENFRTQLIALAKRLGGDVKGLENEAFRAAGGEASGNLSNAPLHLADLGTDTFEEEVTLRLLETEEKTLEETVAAIRRINAGTFGTCERCDRDIADARLQAIPYTRYCVDCARIVQREGGEEDDA